MDSLDQAIRVRSGIGIDENPPRIGRVRMASRLFLVSLLNVDFIAILNN